MLKPHEVSLGFIVPLWNNRNAHNIKTLSHFDIFLKDVPKTMIDFMLVADTLDKTIKKNYPTVKLYMKKYNSFADCVRDELVLIDEKFKAAQLDPSSFGIRKEIQTAYALGYKYWICLLNLH